MLWPCKATLCLIFLARAWIESMQQESKRNKKIDYSSGRPRKETRRDGEENREQKQNGQKIQQERSQPSAALKKREAHGQTAKGTAGRNDPHEDKGNHAHRFGQGGDLFAKSGEPLLGLYSVSSGNLLSVQPLQLRQPCYHVRLEPWPRLTGRNIYGMGQDAPVSSIAEAQGLDEERRSLPAPQEEERMGSAQS